MARTREADALTRAHMEMGEALKAEFIRRNREVALRHIDRANPWNNYDRFLQAAVGTQREYWQKYLLMKMAYTAAFRIAEGVTDQLPQFALPKFDERDAITKVMVAMISPLKKKMAKAVGMEDLTANLTGTFDAGEIDRLILEQADIYSGETQKVVQSGSRDYTMTVAEKDKKCEGWARITDGDPCKFCRMLASRGPVYSSGRKFGTHPRCGCDMELVYEGYQYSDRDQEVIDSYFTDRDKKQDEAREKRLLGETLKKGDLPSQKKKAQGVGTTNSTQAKKNLRAALDSSSAGQQAKSRVQDSDLIRRSQGEVPTKELLRWADLKDPDYGGMKQDEGAVQRFRETKMLETAQARLKTAQKAGKGAKAAKADLEYLAREVVRRRTVREAAKVLDQQL